VHRLPPQLPLAQAALRSRAASTTRRNIWSLARLTRIFGGVIILAPMARRARKMRRRMRN
jgi:hypothetical protein